MIAALKRWRDRQLGRGEASITVPMLDGALKPNRLIEEAEVLAELDAPEDLASDGKTIFVADGKRVLRHDPQAGGGWAAEEVADAPRPITALACLPGGGLALALDGREIVVVGGRHDGCRFDSAGGKPLIALNAITATNDGRLLATDGSQTQPTERWNYDLMELGRSGRVLEFDLSADTSREIASGLAYAYGVCAARDEIWISESWRHRLRRFGSEYSGHTVLDGLPGYPSRLAPAQGGDFWLTCFTLRTQLVEFVLREPAYRKRMIREIEFALLDFSGVEFRQHLSGADAGRAAQGDGHRQAMGAAAVIRAGDPPDAGGTGPLLAAQPLRRQEPWCSRRR